MLAHVKYEGQSQSNGGLSIKLNRFKISCAQVNTSASQLLLRNGCSCTSSCAPFQEVGGGGICQDSSGVFSDISLVTVIKALISLAFKASESETAVQNTGLSILDYTI